MLYILTITENLITFFLLLFTVSFSHRQRKKQKEGSYIFFYIGLFLVLFFFINQASQQFLPSFIKPFFFIPPFLTFLLGTIYIIIFFPEERLSCLVMFISHTLCLLSIRGFFSVISDSLVVLSLNADIRQYLFFIFYYSISVLFSFIFLRHPLRFVSELPVKLILFMFLSPLFIFVLTEFYIDLAYTNSFLYSVSLFFFLLLLLTTVLIYYLFYTVTETYHKKIQSELIQQRLELQLNHVERSVGMVEQIRRDKHEMKNVYFYIQSLIKSGEIKELEEFVDTKLVPRYDPLEEFNTGNQLLDYLLTQKVNEAKNFSIHTYADIIIPSELSVESSDLSGLMMNLLDNAIDASKKEKNGDIHIRMHIMKSYLSIQVKNKVSEDVLKTNPQLHTSKTDSEKHGYGLKIIRSIVEKYNGMINIYTQAGYFCVDILLEI